MASKPPLVKKESGEGDLRPILGKALTYDKGFDKDGYIEDDDEWEKPLAAAEKAAKYGLPAHVRGRPLGCGCNIAHLHAIGKVVKGQLEVDYMCDSGWHNFMVFQVREKKKAKPRQVLIDKFGNLTAHEGFKAQELEEL
jgi:hypothetical protein